VAEEEQSGSEIFERDKVYHGDDGDEGEEDCENRREIAAMIWRARLWSFRSLLLCIHGGYRTVR
jgi:hypothetical protein